MLDELPDRLIVQTIENFETQPDIASLDRIADTLKKTDDLRRRKEEALKTDENRLRAELAELTAGLRELNRPSAATLEALLRLGKPQGGRPAEDDVFRLMNDKSVELDSLKVSLAKQLTDLESSINQLNMAKITLTRQSEELAAERSQAMAQNVLTNFNSYSMKISLYKSFGVHIEEFGDSERIIILDKSSNLTSVLDVDEKYSDYFISNYIWDRMGA